MTFFHLEYNLLSVHDSTVCSSSYYFDYTATAYNKIEVQPLMPLPDDHFLSWYSADKWLQR